MHELYNVISSPTLERWRFKAQHVAVFCTCHFHFDMKLEEESAHPAFYPNTPFTISDALAVVDMIRNTGIRLFILTCSLLQYLLKQSELLSNLIVHLRWQFEAQTL